MEVEDNLRNYLSYRSIDPTTVSLSCPVSLLANNVALFYVKTDKRRLPIEKLRIVVSLCIKMNIKKAYMIVDADITPSYASRLESFKPFLSIETLSISFLSIHPNELYLERKIIVVPKEKEMKIRKDIPEPKDELTLISSTDHQVTWMNISKGSIVEVLEDNGSLYKIVD